MNSRLQKKVYRYALFYFPETNELGTARTSIIAEGYRCSVTVGSLVKVHWENESTLVPAKIIQMDDEMNILWAASRSMEKNIEQLANERHSMIQELEQRGKKRPADQLSSSPNHEPHVGYPVSTASISQVMPLVSINVSPSPSVCFDSLPEPVETPDSGIPVDSGHPDSGPTTTINASPPVFINSSLTDPVCSSTSKALSPISNSLSPSSPVCSCPPEVMPSNCSPSSMVPCFSNSSTSDKSCPVLAPLHTPQTMPPVVSSVSPPTPMCSSLHNLLPPICNTQSFPTSEGLGAHQVLPIISPFSIPTPVFPSPHQVLPPISTGKTPHTSAMNFANLSFCSTSASVTSPMCSACSTLLPPVFTHRSSTTSAWSSAPYRLPPVCASVQGFFQPSSTTFPCITASSSTSNSETHGQLDDLLPIHFSPQPSPPLTPDALSFFSTPPSMSNNPSTQQQISQIHHNSLLHTRLLNQIIQLISGTQLSLTPPTATSATPPIPNKEASAPTHENSIVISDNQIRELKNVSSSKMNFSVKLVKFIFKEDELRNRNVNGGHGRWALDPDKLAKVKEIYFKVYPSDDEATEWKTCVHAINAHLRKYHNRR